MEFLNFDPSEFIVLEEAVEFDETIQRPEKIRFYTLTEQEVDAYEKLLPKGYVSHHDREILKNEVRRVRDLYEQYVLATPDDYKLREPEGGKVFPWVFPVYANPEFKKYDWAASWMPLYENVRAPNFYPRMLSALPKPFAESPEGVPMTVKTPTEFLNADGQKPRRALPIYTATKTIVHEDRTVEIGELPISGTDDTVSFVGYYLAKRPLDIPNPFEGHPFLKANEPVFLPTTSPLSDVVPSMDAVLTHGVPNTSDPYGIAGPYLKLYDIQLANIPWSLWKTKFPPAEVERMVRTQKEIVFPQHEQFSPGEKIQTTYKSEYFPGVSPREWLMRREDGGEFVVKALVSKVIDNGSVQSVPGIDLPIPNYPATTPEECALVGLPFQQFVVQGILRKPASGGFQCVPLEFVKQERAKSGFVGRLPWTETTGAEILDKHIRALRLFRTIGEAPGKEEVPLKTAMKSESLIHQEVVSIENDPKRTPMDKLRDIRRLVNEQQVSNNLYRDADGSFIVCAHTLALLSGDLARDRLGFYGNWTAAVDGFRVCKYCGQSITTLDLVDQDEFTEDGFVIKRTAALETGPTFHGTEIATFTAGLQTLRGLFDMDNPSDAILFLILSLLQVLPDGEALQPFVLAGREITKKLGTKDTEQFKRLKGTVGLAVAAVLLQAHVPTLLPRRSFGSRPLKLDGYPRDLDKPEKTTIVDTLMMVIENTFRAFPTNLSGPTQPVIRGILSNSKDIKKYALIFLEKDLLTQKPIQQALLTAKAYRVGVPVVQQPKTLLPVVMPPETFTPITNYEACPSLRPILASAIAPPILQASVPLRRGILPARTANEVVRSVSVRVPVKDVAKAEIQRKVGISKAKLPIGDGYRTNLMIASRIADMTRTPLDIRSVNPEQKPAELRDIARGFVAESLQKQTRILEMRTKDVALYTLLADYKEEKAQALKLRATERLKFVDEMAKRSDLEREVIGDLLKIGLAPYIITNRDRDLFARQAEQLQEQLQPVVEEDTGVGLPQDYTDQGDVEVPMVDAGNYGDYTAVPVNDGRDYTQPNLVDDAQRSI